MTDAEYAELRKLTIFSITALLPSDAIIRSGGTCCFGRSLTLSKPLKTRPEPRSHRYLHSLFTSHYSWLQSCRPNSSTPLSFRTSPTPFELLSLHYSRVKHSFELAAPLYLRRSATLTQAQAKRV
jgi:hypothetical protein